MSSTHRERCSHTRSNSVQTEWEVRLLLGSRTLLLSWSFSALALLVLITCSALAILLPCSLVLSCSALTLLLPCSLALLVLITCSVPHRRVVSEEARHQPRRLVTKPAECRRGRGLHTTVAERVGGGTTVGNAMSWKRSG